MRYEWDPDKAAANLAKHGVAFEDIRRFDWTTAFTLRDDRKDYREARYVAVGRIGERLYKVVFTWRAGVVRVISMHNANDRDRRKFDERSRRLSRME